MVGTLRFAHPTAPRPCPTASAPPHPAKTRRRRRRRADWLRAWWRCRSCPATAKCGAQRLVAGAFRGQQQDRVIRRDRVFGIVQHHQIVLRDQAVAGVARDHVDLAGGGRGIHEIRLHLPLGAEFQSIGLLQGGPFRPREEFVVRRHRHAGRMRREIGDAANAERLGALARHHQRIGVFEPEFAEQRDVLLRQRSPSTRRPIPARGLMSVRWNWLAHSVPE